MERTGPHYGEKESDLKVHDHGCPNKPSLGARQRQVKEESRVTCSQQGRG